MKKLLYFSLLFLVLCLMPSGVASQNATPGGLFPEYGNSQKTTEDVRDTSFTPKNAEFHSIEDTERDSSMGTVQSKDKDQNKAPLVLSILSMIIGTVAILLVVKLKSDMQKELQSGVQINDALSKRVNMVNTEVGALKQANEELRRQISQLTAVVNRNTTNSQASVVKSGSHTQTSSTKETHNVKQQAAKTKTYQNCYALAQEQGGRILLYEGDDNCRTLFPFIIYHDGSKGEVSFNSDSFAAVVSQLEVKLTPYADCQLKNTSTPSGINTLKKGTATKEGDCWVVINKPVLEVR